MAVPDRSIDPKLLESAKREFLKKGYLAASLGEICQNAGITTGALYKRYKGKEDLFEAVVSRDLYEIREVTEKKGRLDLKRMTDRQLTAAWQMDEDYMLWWYRFLYERHDTVVLLLKCSDGTKFANFNHDFVQDMVKYSYLYYKEAFERGLCASTISEKEMHTLLSSFWTSIYEPFIHDWSMEEIEAFTPLVCGLFDWNKTLKIKQI